MPLFFFRHRMIFYHALRTHHLDTLLLKICKTMVLQHVKQRGIMPPFEVAPCVLLPLNKERKSVMSEFEEKRSKGPLKLSHEEVHKCQRSVSEWFLTLSLLKLVPLLLTPFIRVPLYAFIVRFCYLLTFSPKTGKTNNIPS